MDPSPEDELLGGYNHPPFRAAQAATRPQTAEEAAEHVNAALGATLYSINEHYELPISQGWGSVVLDSSAWDGNAHVVTAKIVPLQGLRLNPDVVMGLGSAFQFVATDPQDPAVVCHHRLDVDIDDKYVKFEAEVTYTGGEEYQIALTLHGKPTPRQQATAAWNKEIFGAEPETPKWYLGIALLAKVQGADHMDECITWLITPHPELPDGTIPLNYIDVWTFDQINHYVRRAR